MVTITILITAIVLLALLRPFTVLVHELGHGIPALLLTKKKVHLFIGSLGDPNRSLHITLGRLEIFFKYNPFLWNLGLCIPKSTELSINRSIIITLFGPLVSLIIGAASIYVVLKLNLHGGLKLIGIFIFISSLIDFFINIIPSPDPIVLNDGSISYNDGQQLIQLIKYKILPSQFTSGVEYYNTKEYKKAAIEFQNILQSGIKDEQIFRLTIASLLLSKNYQTALTVHEEFKHLHIYNSNDYCNSGLIKSKLDIYEEGISDFNKSLEIDPLNIYSLNNRGYTYILIEEFEKAILDFDKVIEIDSCFAYSYNNRGLAKIKMGNEKDGLNDINKSLELDDENSYAYRNLGIYYFDNYKYQKALNQFERADEFDAETHLLQEYILKTKKEINKSFD